MLRFLLTREDQHDVQEQGPVLLGKHLEFFFVFQKQTKRKPHASEGCANEIYFSQTEKHYEVRCFDDGRCWHVRRRSNPVTDPCRRRPHDTTIPQWMAHATTLPRITVTARAVRAPDTRTAAGRVHDVNVPGYRGRFAARASLYSFFRHNVRSLSRRGTRKDSIRINSIGNANGQNNGPA